MEQLALFVAYGFCLLAAFANVVILYNWQARTTVLRLAAWKKERDAQGNLSDELDQLSDEDQENIHNTLMWAFAMLGAGLLQLVALVLGVLVFPAMALKWLLTSVAVVDWISSRFKEADGTPHSGVSKASYFYSILVLVLGPLLL